VVGPLWVDRGQFPVVFEWLERVESGNSHGRPFHRAFDGEEGWITDFHPLVFQKRPFLSRRSMISSNDR
jgi:hypothetical protein